MIGAFASTIRSFSRVSIRTYRILAFQRIFDGSAVFLCHEVERVVDMLETWCLYRMVLSNFAARFFPELSGDTVLAARRLGRTRSLSGKYDPILLIGISKERLLMALVNFFNLIFLILSA